MGMGTDERLVERLKTGSTADIMAGIEQRLRMHEASGYAGCGALMKKALKYALAEWPAMKRVLENGDVEISNNLAEQMMRHIKMNLKTASNIGSEESALDNAFMFSLIESCKLNGLAPEKYIAFLLRKLKGANQHTDKNALLLHRVNSPKNEKIRTPSRPNRPWKAFYEGLRRSGRLQEIE